MKFTKISTKFNKLLKKKKRGKKINKDKLLKLQELLNAKKSKFEERLKGELTDEKRSSLESKLRVVNAQIAKSQTLLSNQTGESQNEETS